MNRSKAGHLSRTLADGFLEGGARQHSHQHRPDVRALLFHLHFFGYW